MKWDSKLLPDQKQAASRTERHVCILAGPGTGKTLTLTHRILFLVQEKDVKPDEILALTFTRAATYELRNRTHESLGTKSIIFPKISTLHSFALSQLLRNASIVTMVPRPLRIADDWEERNIIEEDLKRVLDLDVRNVRKKFNQLSADWETLNVEKANWEKNYPDPKFLTAWRTHREIYGYMLRSELVYQLKKSIEQNPDFKLDHKYKHILIDKYQDLNKCDLEVVKRLTEMGANLYVTGDDDQSIYGFRFAYPQGIRMFDQDYIPSKIIPLENCVRCGENILKIALFIASLDVSRKEKLIKAYNKELGEVHLLNFSNQNEESKCVAQICKHLIKREKIAPRDILILTRSDRHGIFSDLLKSALKTADVPVATQGDIDNPLDKNDGRIFLSFLRLLNSNRDHLALVTLLKLRDNNIGDQTITKIYQLAVNEGLSFINAIEKVLHNPELLDINVNMLKTELTQINKTLSEFKNIQTNREKELGEFIKSIALKVIKDNVFCLEVTNYLNSIIKTSGVKNLHDLLATISTTLSDKEQDIDVDSVNILTMHKAKGLTADVVFIVGVEDEYIPGEQLGELKEGDERRLLYVSLTRAKKILYITYCNRRTERQRWSGRTSGKMKRTISRFIADSPLKPENGNKYLQQITN